MCFIVNKDNTKVQIADKDIVCWKEMDRIANGQLQTPYERFVYEKGKVYKRNCLTKKEYVWITELYRGFHSYIVKKRIEEWLDDLIIIKFIIPKGARYLKNIHNEYISNQIIMI